MSRYKKLSQRKLKLLREALTCCGYTLSDISSWFGYATHASALQKFNGITAFSEAQIEYMLNKCQKIIDKCLEEERDIKKYRLTIYEAIKGIKNKNDTK